MLVAGIGLGAAIGVERLAPDARRLPAPTEETRAAEAAPAATPQAMPAELTPEQQRVWQLRQLEAGITWRNSRAVGEINDGRLVNGVLLPPEGVHFFTWDFPKARSPNRERRRWGTDRLVRLILKVAEDHAAAHPDAPRITVGDLSRPKGGPFGRKYGGDGHASHQNGLDVDIYYPRKDRAERVPAGPEESDLDLAQDLVDRFVDADVEFVFVGHGTGLSGPTDVVQAIGNHHDHMHVRIRNAR